MKKSIISEGLIIELPKDVIKRISFKNGDWLKVKLLNGKEIILQKPKKDYWDETFSWGKKYAKEQKIRSKDVVKAIREVRSGK